MTHRNFNLALAVLIAALLCALGGLLDGPSELDAARATAFAVQDSKQRAALMHRQKTLAKKQALKRAEHLAWSAP